MMQLARRPVGLVAMISIAGAACAQSDYSWDGLYAGLNAGGASNTTCNSWSLDSATFDPTIAAAFSKNFTSTGWVAGGGVELVLSGPWSISAEYLHANLGKGSNSTTTCTGTASACAAFSGVSLDSTHNSFTADMFRIGINYWFWY
jgi:opacity protein-like surface antigen